MVDAGDLKSFQACATNRTSRPRQFFHRLCPESLARLAASARTSGITVLIETCAQMKPPSPPATPAPANPGKSNQIGVTAA